MAGALKVLAQNPVQDLRERTLSCRGSTSIYALLGWNRRKVCLKMKGVSTAGLDIGL